MTNSPTPAGSAMTMRGILAREVRKVLGPSGKHMLTYAIVDAVLAALRDPTPEMVEAGDREHKFTAGIWRAMIDAAAAPAPEDGR
jgi:hypothetical protein